MLPDRTSIERHVDKVLAGAEFARSDRMARFLRFIVQSTLDARSSDLKERTIGIAVFDRSADWDPKTDTIVRSEARRLRAKLESYYETAGADDKLRVRVPKGGYVPEFELIQTTFPPPPAPPPKKSPPNRRPYFVAAALATLLAALLLFLPRRAEDRRAENFEIRPFANAFGRELQPAVSPDGQKIAFVWDGDGDTFDIYVKTVQTGELSRITKGPQPSLHPSWSPDGRTLAFIRLSDSKHDVLSGASIVLHSLANGSEKAISRINVQFGRWAGESTPLNGDPGPIWTPDGKSLIAADYNLDGNLSGLESISVADGVRHLLVRSPHSTRDFLPRLSPNGRRLAFVRYRSHGSGDIVVTDLSGGPETQLTSDNRTISGLAWTPDGQNLVFASNRRASYQLWEIPSTGGTIQHLPTDSTVADVAVSPKGDWLAVVSVLENWNIWRVALQPAGSFSPQRFLSSSGRNHTPRYSPDGRNIAFVSDRSGSWEVWICDSEGRNLRQLTHTNSPWLGGLSWSPDSQELAMDARPNGHSGIFVANVSNGLVRTIENNSFEERLPAWSRDGRSIYFNSDRDGRVAIWKLTLAIKALQKVAPDRTFLSAESPDAHSIYFNMDDGELWTALADGTHAAPVAPPIICSPTINWTLLGNNILYTRETDRGAAEFWRYSKRGPELLGTIDGQVVPATPSLTVSPDGHWLLFASQDSAASDINLRFGKLP